MSKRLMTRKEFLEQKGRMRFEVNPLDIGLAQMQHELLKKLRARLRGEESGWPIEEHYESKDPTLQIETVTLECLRRESRPEPYQLWMTVSDREFQRQRQLLLTKGSAQQMEAYLDSSALVSAAKGHVLYLDYEFRNYKTFTDYIAQVVALVRERAEDEVTESGDFAPVLETFVNPSMETEDIVGSYGLRIYKMPRDVVADPAIRYIEASAYEPSGQYKSTQTVGSGTKAEVLEILAGEEIIDKLNHTYGRLLDTLRD